MTKAEVQTAYVNKDALYWHDPDPIPGNDYKITAISFYEESCLIEYGESQAEIYYEEIKDYPL